MKEDQCLELKESVMKDLETMIESEKLVVEDYLTEQMMVNKALEVEKDEAEKRAEEWKRKFEKLAETVRKLDEIGVFRIGEVELDEDVKLGLELASVKLKKKMESNHQVLGCCSPYVTTPVKSGRNRVNKMLVFEDDTRKSTDSETEEYEDEDVGACEFVTNTPLSCRKRKRVITSDSESDDEEDNIPIATLKNLKPPQNQEMFDLVDETPVTGDNVSAGLRRLRKQRDLEEISTPSECKPTDRLVGVQITGNAEDDETEEESERESETESLNGFIVADEPEEYDGTEGCDAPDEEESDGETGYADVMAMLRRDKKPGEEKWEYVTDMQADFGKDDELCMRAVCVLYRFQTEDEKATRSTYVANGRGFDMSDACRGTLIGQFLTDGDPCGDLKKSVEELRSFKFDAVEICRDLAGKYSKQLFEVYNNKEDPFFAAPPSP